MVHQKNNTSNAETHTQSIQPKKSEESDDKQDRINTNDEESLVQLAENANNDQDQKHLDEDNHPKKNTDNVAAAEKVNEKEDDFTNEPDSQNSSKLPNKKNVKASNNDKGKN